MDLARLQALLDCYGGDLSLWPQPDREAAERLLAIEQRARLALGRARRLDVLIAREVAAPAAAEVEQSEATAARLLEALAARPLPPQRRPMLPWRWPALLLDVDFAPAWPRIAALACAAALGVGVGLFGGDTSLFAGRNGAAIAAAETDLLTLVFEPEPLTGAAP